MTKLLLLGGTGLVGSRVWELLTDAFEIIAPSSKELDVTNFQQVKNKLSAIQPELILYAAGFTNVDLAEQKRKDCFLLNVKAVEFFVTETAKLNIPFYYLSTDYVFDGTKDNKPYTEDDIPNPVDSVYAKSKRVGELATLSNDINGVVRLIMPFSAVHKLKMDIARLVLDELTKGQKLFGIVDQKINPIFVDDLVYALGKIMQNRSSGIYHVAALDFTTPFDFMMEIAKQFNLPQSLIGKTTFAEFSQGRPAKRPQHTWLDATKFRREFGEEVLHELKEEIRLFKAQIDSQGGFRLN